MLHIFLLEHGHAAALLATDAIPAACYSDTVFNCPGQLGTSPAVSVSAAHAGQLQAQTLYSF